MDPVSMIVTSLAAGASAALTSTAKQVVIDAYEGVKTLIKRKYGSVNIEMLESDPKSKSRQDVVKEDLEKAEAVRDAELLDKVKLLMETIRDHAPEATGAVGVKLEDFKAAVVEIEDVVSSGTAIDARRVEIKEHLRIKNVRAGQGGSNLKN